MSLVTSPARPAGTADRYGAAGAAIVIGQAVVAAAIGVATSTFYPQSHDPSSPDFNSWGAVLVVLHLLLAAGVASLVATRAAGRGRLANLAYAVVLAGLVMQAVAEAVLRFSFATGNTLFSICMPFIAIAFVFLGVAIVRAHRWGRWTRLVPFACGLYIPLLMIPAFALAGGVSFPAIAGWQFLFLLLGLAMWVEARKANEAGA